MTPSKNLKIRPATPADLPTLQQLGYELLELERQSWDSSLDPHWPFSPSGQKAYASAIAEKFTILAEASGQPVGFLIGTIRHPQPDDARHLVTAQLNNIYVKETWRQHGVGRQLFAQFKDHCHSQQVDKIDVTVNAQNSTAIDFYQQAGFTPSRLFMSLPLSSQG